MKWDFKKIFEQAKEDAFHLQDMKSIEDYRIKYLGKKGLVAEIYASLPVCSPEQKPEVGKGANDLKVLVNQLLETKKEELTALQKNTKSASFDLTIPGVSRSEGHLHLLNQVIEEICGIFKDMGFAIQEGPEIETEFNNFDALNIPPEHPSRDGLDTFYVDISDPLNSEKYSLLRSQTSPVQIRVMSHYQPPLAIIAPGKVYRPDAVDASHSFMFHQIEGLLVDQDIKFSDLKGTMHVFCKRFFGENIRMRFRPHFFPFTEPSAEIDISCYICGGKGCSVCGRKGWLEIMGCGMVHPNVFKACGYEEGKYTGFAFGLGVERIAMLRYGINDIRIFYENDLRFLSQF